MLFLRTDASRLFSSMKQYILFLKLSSYKFLSLATKGRLRDYGKERKF